MRGEVVYVELMLMTTLRYLAGGMVWDIALALDIGPGSFYRVIWQTMEAINEVYEINFSMEPYDLQRTAKEFAAIRLWTRSQLYNKVLSAGKLPKRYFFIGDEAFSCEEQMLTPWSGRGLESKKDSFNYHLSDALSREGVERPFHAGFNSRAANTVAN